MSSNEPVQKICRITNYRRRLHLVTATADFHGYCELPWLLQIAMTTATCYDYTVGCRGQCRIPRPQWVAMITAQVLALGLNK